MSEIAIYADSKGPGTCRSCGARITWAETTAGKRMPLDGREIVPVRSQGDVLGGGRTIEFLDTSITTPHWATCPDADKWRRR